MLQRGRISYSSIGLGSKRPSVTSVGSAGPFQCWRAGAMWLGEQSMAVGRADVHFLKGGVAWNRASPWRCCILSLRSIVQVKPHGNDYEGGHDQERRLGKGQYCQLDGGGAGAPWDAPSPVPTPPSTLLPCFLRFIHICENLGGCFSFSHWERLFGL